MPAKITIEDVMAKVHAYGAQCTLEHGTGYAVQQAFGSVRWTLACLIAQTELDASKKIDDTISTAVNEALQNHILGE